ncbi:hypothetical protein HYPSUDRAFT_209888 [Hypholoma sublateritium FD-334 SS-4]|uniref:Uncharacterized protein n=1 Tax=Hypholoma sublateritium (strain FD-334 SS-4) TaxID=945553 RepID=A0A0D2NWV9_HYPSF|nr:hypothetical protein HYPSUDRAFT_209888 [Hypholoma sublateritium FD-334 SS-4]
MTHGKGKNKAKSQYRPAPRPEAAHEMVQDEGKGKGKATDKMVCYEIKIFGLDEPVIKYDTVPAALCVPQPPLLAKNKFVDSLIRKYSNEVVTSLSLPCWNCTARATGLAHAPKPFLQLSNPKVVDLAFPVCAPGGNCAGGARVVMAGGLGMLGPEILDTLELV